MNTKAGQYYTPREVVKLLVSLTMCGKEQELFIPGKAFTINALKGQKRNKYDR